MTDGLTIDGAWYMPGATVGVVIAGLDCGNYVVASDGSVFVPFSSDPDKLLTPSYLNSVSDPNNTTNTALTTFTITNGSGDVLTISVPILIGYVYASAGRLLRPVTEGETKSAQGPSLGKKRRTHRIAALLKGAVGIAFSCDSTNKFDTAQFTDAGGNTLTHDKLFSGVYRKEVDDTWSFDGMLSWQITRPYPCTIVALSGFLETSET